VSTEYRDRRDQEGDRRDRSSRDGNRDSDDRRGRFSREDRDAFDDRHLRGNSDPKVSGFNVEGEVDNQEFMVKLVRNMATPEVMSLFQHSRLAESLMIRCTAAHGRQGNNVEEAMANERGTGTLQTLAGVIAENLSMHFAPKLLDLLRTNPRANWPLGHRRSTWKRRVHPSYTMFKYKLLKAWFTLGPVL